MTSRCVLARPGAVWAWQATCPSTPLSTCSAAVSAGVSVGSTPRAASRILRSSSISARVRDIRI
ncbi:MAG: hypothetical protein K2M02_07380 [Duncaniella sp.]|nr:hypothetical protein [Duncaniella sp.]